MDCWGITSETNSDTFNLTNFWLLLQCFFTDKNLLEFHALLIKGKTTANVFCFTLIWSGFLARGKWWEILKDGTSVTASWALPETAPCSPMHKSCSYWTNQNIISFARWHLETTMKTNLCMCLTLLSHLKMVTKCSHVCWWQRQVCPVVDPNWGQSF